MYPISRIVQQMSLGIIVKKKMEVKKGLKIVFDDRMMI
jgi:hypothetical protein